jgi:hypothetical protein
VQTHLGSGDFRASAAKICREERIIIAGAERGTVSSSLIVAGKEIQVYHIQGDPRDRDYQEFRLSRRL